jgi:predicted RNase H-like nuclease (RuvC/YqgF family)
MKRVAKTFLSGLGSALVWTGCASTSDPNVDSIGFSPARAERERIAPRQARLWREEGGAEAERIRSLALKQKLRENENQRQSDEDEIKRLRAQIAAGERELKTLNDRVAAARGRGEENDRLIHERNLRQAEVDRLSAILYRLLQNE